MEEEKTDKTVKKKPTPNIPSAVNTVNKFTHITTNKQLHTELTFPIGSTKYCRQNYKPRLTCKYRNSAKLLIVLSLALANAVTPFSQKLKLMQ